MYLTPEVIEEATKCICKESFVPTEEVIPQHILFNQFHEHYPNFPKLIFYIVIDNLFGFAVEKAENKDLGRRLKFDINLVPEHLKPRK